MKCYPKSHLPMRTWAMLFLLFVSTSLYADENLQKVFKAPNGTGMVKIVGPIYTNLGWSLEYSSNGKDFTTLWISVRSPKIYWSPDGHWLAIEDHIMRLSTAVLIFDCSKAKPILNYQTPFSETEYSLKFFVDAWQVKNKRTSLKLYICSSDDESQRLNFVVTPQPKNEAAMPNIYNADPDYGIPTKKKPKSGDTPP